MRGAITALRDVVPLRPLSVTESLKIAEMQAERLLELTDIATPPVPEWIIAELPRVEVERLTPSPVSGAARWSRGRWLIIVNAGEPPGRQRFSLAHEFKHVLDHPFVEVLYPGVCTMTSEQRAEQVCDYFAACLLMPRRWLVRHAAELGDDPNRLARRFNVSRSAMQRRLKSVGVTANTVRCIAKQQRKEAANVQVPKQQRCTGRRRRVAA